MQFHYLPKIQVFADGKRVTDVDSPSSKLTKVTVATKAINALVFMKITQYLVILFQYCSITGDHALIDLGCIGHFNPKLITVRSKSRELLSIDSPAIPILGTAKQTKRGSSKMVCIHKLSLILVIEQYYDCFICYSISVW